MPADPDSQWVTRFVRAAKVDVQENRLVGLPIVFNSLSQDLGGWKERIAPSAVDRTLKSGANVDALVDHRRETSTIIGSTDSGLLRMEKQTRGLQVKIMPPDTTAVRDLLTVVRAGLARGMSFAFRPYEYPDGTRGVVWTEEDGELIRTVTDMEFSEVSVVVNPAYLETEISARSRTLDAGVLEEYRRSTTWKPSMKFRERMLRVGQG